MAATSEQEEKLRQILTHLDERLGQTDAENRQRMRLPLRMTLTVTVLSGIAPAPVEIFTRNISASGLGFVSRRLFHRNERLVISLRIPNLPGKMLLARVTFGRYVQGGIYEMGSEFLESVADPRGTAQIPNHWLAGAHQVRVADASM
jgi:hypothetical protein